MHSTTQPASSQQNKRHFDIPRCILFGRLERHRSPLPYPRLLRAPPLVRVALRLLHRAPLLLCQHRDGGLSCFLCRRCSCPKFVHLCMRRHPAIPTPPPSSSSSCTTKTKIFTATAAVQLRATLAPIHSARLRTPKLLLRLLLGAHHFKYVARISAVRSTSRERRRAAIVMLHPKTAAAESASVVARSSTSCASTVHAPALLPLLLLRRNNPALRHPSLNRVGLQMNRRDATRVGRAELLGSPADLRFARPGSLWHAQAPRQHLRIRVQLSTVGAL